MRRYLATLACSGLLSIGALYGIPAFAGSIPGSTPDTAPTTDAAGGAFHPLSAQASFEPAVLVGTSSGSVTSGLQFVAIHGGGHGGGGGGWHGGGGFHGDFHGMEGFHGMDGRHFVQRRRGGNFFFDDGGGAFFGFGVPYSYCNPYYPPGYYGSCYPGY